MYPQTSFSRCYQRIQFHQSEGVSLKEREKWGPENMQQAGVTQRNSQVTTGQLAQIVLFGGESERITNFGKSRKL